MRSKIILLVKIKYVNFLCKPMQIKYGIRNVDCDNNDALLQAAYVQNIIIMGARRLLASSSAVTPRTEGQRFIQRSKQPLFHCYVRKKKAKERKYRY